MLLVVSVATELLGLVVVAEVELLGLVLDVVVSVGCVDVLVLAVVLELLGVVDDVEVSVEVELVDEVLGLVELDEVLG